MVLLLCPPAPFVNGLANPVSFANDLLEGKCEDSVKSQQRQLLAGVLAASKSEIALKILDRGLLLEELKEPLPEDPTRRLPALEHALAFWTCVS